MEKAAAWEPCWSPSPLDLALHHGLRHVRVDGLRVCCRVLGRESCEDLQRPMLQHDCLHQRRRTVLGSRADVAAGGRRGTCLGRCLLVSLLGHVVAAVLVQVLLHGALRLLACLCWHILPSLLGIVLSHLLVASEVGQMAGLPIWPALGSSSATFGFNKFPWLRCSSCFRMAFASSVRACIIARFSRSG